ncbi:MAG: hypothetical protein HC921_18835 [Synechococcaceae cyanobacterium SM2_3_1]|nr:hypothetical protein [Synechococcaceae cyanobacterium SM2_3_1]
MASRRKSGSSLSQAQMRAAGLMVAGWSNEQVAQELGIHPCTVAHWKADQRFSEYLNLLQHEANQRILERVVAASTKALDHLEEMIEDPNSSWMQKMTVARKILETLNTG